MPCCRVCYRNLHPCGKCRHAYSASLEGRAILSVGICISFLQMQQFCPRGTCYDLFHTKCILLLAASVWLRFSDFSLNVFSAFLLLRVSVSLWFSNTDHHRIVLFYLQSFHSSVVLLCGLPITIVSSKLKSESLKNLFPKTQISCYKPRSETTEHISLIGYRGFRNAFWFLSYAADTIQDTIL